MGVDLEHRPAGAAAATPGVSSPAAGKRVRTEGLPAREPRHHEMTGIPLLDDGLYCRSQPEGTEGCHLDERQEDDLLKMIGIDALAFCGAAYSALGRIRAELLTAKARSYTGTDELIYLLVTAAITGPMAAALSTYVVHQGVRWAEAGAHRVGWAMAGYSPDKAARALGFGFRAIRGQLAHPGHKAPRNQLEYVAHLESLVQPTANNILQGVAAEQLNHDEMLALHDKLNDPALVSPDAIYQRCMKLLDGFEENRLGTIGNRQFGSREVAIPVRVKYRKREYVALCESFGVRHLAAELNGANIDDKEPRLTMDSLVFVKLVERPFHQLMMDEYRERRKEEPPAVDFGTAAGRAAHRWANDFRLELMHHADPLGITVVGGAKADVEDGIDD